MGNEQVTVELVQQKDYRFDIQFGAAVPNLIGDEPAPMGTGAGPSPRPAAVCCRRQLLE